MGHELSDLRRVITHDAEDGFDLRDRRKIHEGHPCQVDRRCSYAPRIRRDAVRSGRFGLPPEGRMERRKKKESVLARVADNTTVIA